MAQDYEGMSRQVDLTLQWQPETFVILVTAPEYGDKVDCPEIGAVEVRVRLAGELVGEVDTTIVVVPTTQSSAFMGLRSDVGNGRVLSITIEEARTRGKLSGSPVQLEGLLVSPPIISW